MVIHAGCQTIHWLNESSLLKIAGYMEDICLVSLEAECLTPNT